jgi:protein-S-isoprenylcysteine O-methyltransferase Ste14
MNIRKLLYTVFSISGIVPDHITVLRILFIGASILFSIFILPKYALIDFAIIYFALSTLVYLGFISAVLPEKGLRCNLIKWLGEEKAYLYYEGFLAFAFLHNGISLGFISQSSIGSGPWNQLSPTVMMVFTVFLFIVGMGTKIWSAYVVGIPIYYWKDMFLGRKIGNFVVSGPYKYFNNPMYGVGQLQVYAIALYYDSLYGLIFAAINQATVFLFYVTVEKPFINRVYRVQN